MPTLYATQFGSSIGELTVASSTQGLAYLALPRANGRGFEGWCCRYAADHAISEDAGPNRQVIDQVGEFLAGARELFDLPLDLRATSFQLDVYKVVSEIPYGESLAYGEVARRVGRAAAVRAVGAANGANPIPLVIPCHRVVASNGHLQGYSGGLELKRKLLAMERASHPAQGALL
ncbi:MAG: methylated-DNA--[protein]-cysteine S-methyltransferase [Myxococcota bacterium]|nr:methylated-DNA--[protein]-cysteine S-methyltransferase [Myxococcota bacterium]